MKRLSHGLYSSRTVDKSYALTCQMYKFLLPYQIISAIVPNLASVISSLVVGNFIGADALVIIGLICPITFITAAVINMFATGASVVLGDCIGRGNYKKVNSIFTTLMASACGFSVLLIAIIFLFTEQVLTLLGTPQQLLATAVPYFRVVALGYLPGILTPIIIVFLNMGNHVTYATATSTVIAISNVVLSLAAVLLIARQLLLIAVATALASYIGLFMLLFKLVRNPDIARFDIRCFDPSVLKSAVKSGSSICVTKICCSLRLMILNLVALSVAGVDGVTGLTVMNNTGLLVAVLVSGAVSSSNFLASVSAGEMDITGLKNTIKSFMRIALPMVLCGALLYGGFARPISAIYGVSGNALHCATLCTIAYAVSVFLEAILSQIIDVYLIVLKKEKLSASISVCVNLLLPAVVCLLANRFGSIGMVYSAYPVPVFITILFVIILSTVKNGHLPKEPFDLVRPVPEFENANVHMLSMTVTDIDSAIAASTQIVEFCRQTGIDKKKAYYAGLCTEEMAINFVNHAELSHSKKPMLDILLNVLDSEIRLRLRDNTPEFNPVERLKLAKAKDDDPLANIGIKTVSAIAKSMDYKQNYKMNVTNIVL